MDSEIKQTALSLLAKLATRTNDFINDLSPYEVGLLALNIGLLNQINAPAMQDQYTFILKTLLSARVQSFNNGIEDIQQFIAAVDPNLTVVNDINTKVETVSEAPQAPIVIRALRVAVDRLQQDPNEMSLFLDTFNSDLSDTEQAINSSIFVSMDIKSQRAKDKKLDTKEAYAETVFTMNLLKGFTDVYDLLNIYKGILNKKFNIEAPEEDQEKKRRHGKAQDAKMEALVKEANEQPMETHIAAMADVIVQRFSVQEAEILTQMLARDVKHPFFNEFKAMREQFKVLAESGLMKFVVASEEEAAVIKMLMDVGEEAIAYGLNDAIVRDEEAGKVGFVIGLEGGQMTSDLTQDIEDSKRNFVLGVQQPALSQARKSTDAGVADYVFDSTLTRLVSFIAPNAETVQQNMNFNTNVSISESGALQYNAAPITLDAEAVSDLKYELEADKLLQAA